jgi:hypothetical protein
MWNYEKPGTQLNWDVKVEFPVGSYSQLQLDVPGFNIDTRDLDTITFENLIMKTRDAGIYSQVSRSYQF